MSQSPILTDLLDCRASTPEDSTLTVPFLSLLWDTLVQDRLLPWVMPLGDINTFEDFLRYNLSPNVWAFGGFSWNDGKPVAYAQVTNFEGSTARVHYTGFRNDESRKNLEAYAKAFFDFLFWNGSIDTLILITPKCYRHVNSFIKRIGGEYQGSIVGLYPRKNRKGKGHIFDRDNLYTVTSPFYTENKIRTGDD